MVHFTDLARGAYSSSSQILLFGNHRFPKHLEWETSSQQIYTWTEENSLARKQEKKGAGPSFVWVLSGLGAPPCGKELPNSLCSIMPRHFIIHSQPVTQRQGLGFLLLCNLLLVLPTCTARCEERGLVGISFSSWCIYGSLSPGLLVHRGAS